MLYIFRDVWSFGVLCYEIFACCEPYPGMTNAEVKEKVIGGYKMQFPDETPQDLVDLIMNHCWAFKAEDRWTMSQVVKKLQEITGIPAPNQQSSNLSSNVSSGAKKHKKSGKYQVQQQPKRGDSGINAPGSQSTRTKKQGRKKRNN